MTLYRGFAWNEQGSPKKEFRLTAELVLRAEQEVRGRLLAQR